MRNGETEGPREPQTQRGWGMAQTLAEIKDGGAHSGGDQEGRELSVCRHGGCLRLWSLLT